MSTRYVWNKSNIGQNQSDSIHSTPYIYSTGGDTPPVQITYNDDSSELIPLYDGNSTETTHINLGSGDAISLSSGTSWTAEPGWYIKIGRNPGLLYTSDGATVRIHNSENVEITGDIRSVRYNRFRGSSNLGTISNAASSTYPLSYIQQQTTRNCVNLRRCKNVA